MSVYKCAFFCSCELVLKKFPRMKGNSHGHILDTKPVLDSEGKIKSEKTETGENDAENKQNGTEAATIKVRNRIRILKKNQSSNLLWV